MQASTEQLLNAIAQLPAQELEEVVGEILKLRAQRQVPHLSASESELLLRINRSISRSQRERFDQLVARRQALTITEDELTELIEITEQLEQLNAERMQAIAALARLRNQTLPQVMQALGIQPAACV